MSIYVKGVLSNIGENALCRKNGQFWHKIELLRESTSPIMLKFGLEIVWGMIQKSDAAIFEILIFCFFQGVKVQKWPIWTKIWTLTPWKIAKNQNFKNRRITFLYHPKIYLQPKFQHQRTCRFLDPSRFMRKFLYFFNFIKKISLKA